VWEGIYDMSGKPGMSAALSLRPGLAPMVWWYWRLIDEMVANPHLDKKELAQRFRVTPQTIYNVTGSDAFKAAYAQRVREFQEKADEGLRRRLMTVADKSLQVIETVIDKKQDAIPLRQLNEIATSALERLGYGVAQNGVTVNTNGLTQVVVPVSRDALESARAALRANEVRKVVEDKDDNTSNGGEYGQQADSTCIDLESR
jgi:hypothetical protein